MVRGCLTRREEELDQLEHRLGRLGRVAEALRGLQWMESQTEPLVLIGPEVRRVEEWVKTIMEYKGPGGT